MKRNKTIKLKMKKLLLPWRDVANCDIGSGIRTEMAREMAKEVNREIIQGMKFEKDLEKRWRERKRIIFESFIHYFNELSQRAHRVALRKGWWTDGRTDQELLLLMHCELSEAVEHLRYGNRKSDHIKRFTGLEEELADVCIRIFDMASARKLRVAEAIVAKMRFNEKRSYRHGGKNF